MSEATLPKATPTRAADAGALRHAARYARYIFWLMFLINLVNYADRFVFSGFSKIIQDEFGFNDSQIGFLASGFLLVYALVAFAFGFLADRTSRKNIVAAGVAVWSLATALTAVASSFGAMLFARTIVGIGEGSYYPAGTPMLAAYFPPSRRAQVFSRWSVGSLVGGAVGFLITEAILVLLGRDYWRVGFYVAAVPGLILAFLFFRTREKIRHEDDPVAEQAAAEGRFYRATREYLGIRTVRVVIAMQALGFFALFSIATFLIIYLSDVYGQSGPYGASGLPDTLTVLLPSVILLVGGIAGNLLGGALADRMSRRTSGARVRVGGIGFLLSAPTVAITLAAPLLLRTIPAYTALAPGTQIGIGVAIFTVFGLLASTTLNFYNGPASAAVQDVVPPDGRAYAGGLTLTLSHLFGDVYAAFAVGSLSDALAFVGNQHLGIALLLTCPVVLIASGIVGIWGSRFYARDVAALGTSAQPLLGTADRVS